MSSIFLRTMGYPVLFGPDGQPIRVRVGKHMALLVYLAVEPRVKHRRDTLADLLWPAGDQRHSLSTGLTMIRTLLGNDAIKTGGDAVSFATTMLATDVEALGGAGPTPTSPNPPLEIEPFLHGFDLGDATAFMQWRDVQAVRLRPAMRRSVLADLSRCRQRGDHQEMEHHAQRLLTLDDLDEDGVRAQMEIRVLGSDRIGALTLYERWRERLLDELGAEPTAGTLDLVRRLRRGDWQAYFPAPSPEQTVRSAPPLLVGMEHIHSSMEPILQAVAAGEKYLLSISSTIGKGKSSSARVIADLCQVNGASVAFVSVGSLQIGLQPIASLAEALSRASGAAATSPSSLQILRTMGFRVDRQFPDVRPLDIVDADLDHRHVAAFAELLESVCSERWVALVVDDFHLLDPAAAQFLFAAISAASSASCALVVTSASEAILQRPELNELVTDFEYANRASRLHINTVEIEELRKLAQSRVLAASKEPTRAELELLVRAAGGYSGELDLILKDYIANGRGCLILAAERLAGSKVEPSPLYDKHKHALERACAAISDAGRLAIARLAVDCSQSSTQWSAAFDPDQSADQSDFQTLRASGILAESCGQIMFTSVIYQLLSYFSAPEWLREKAHLAAVHRGYDDHTDSWPTRWAFAKHLARSGHTAPAVNVALEASSQALSVGCLLDAEAMAIAAKYFAPMDVRPRIAIAYALNNQGRWFDSLTEMAGISSDSLAQGAPDEVGITVEAMLRANQFTSEEIAIAASRALSTLRMNDGDRSRSHLALVCARLFAQVGDGDDYRSAVVLLNEIAETLEHNHAATAASLGLAMLAFQARALDVCEQHLMKASQRLMPEFGASLAGLHLNSGFGSLYLAKGDLQLAHAYKIEALRIANGLHNQTEEALICLSLSIIQHRMGNCYETVHWGVRSFELSNYGGGYPEIGAYYAGLGYLRLGERRLVGAQIQRILGAYNGEHGPRRALRCSLLAADLYWLLGNGKEALSIAAKVLATEAPPAFAPADVGLVARWYAMLHNRGYPVATAAIALIQGEMRREGDCDPLTQIELRWAHHICSVKRAKVAAQWAREINELRRVIPSSAMFVCDQTLGVLEIAKSN